MWRSFFAFSSSLFEIMKFNNRQFILWVKRNRILTKYDVTDISAYIWAVLKPRDIYKFKNILFSKIFNVY